MSKIEYNILDPDMSTALICGVLGLSCTLNSLENHIRSLYDLSEVPDSLWKDGQRTWELDSTTLTIHLDEPEDAYEVMRYIHEYGFKLKDGLLYMPGQYSGETKEAVKVAAHMGAMYTILNPNTAKRWETGSSPIIKCEIDGELCHVKYRRCKKLLMANYRKELTEESGQLSNKWVKINQSFLPGACVKHPKKEEATCIRVEPKNAFALMFLPVAAISFYANRQGIMVIPKFRNLEEAAMIRPILTGQEFSDMIVASADDAVLSMQLRYEAVKNRCPDVILGWRVVICKKLPWGHNQKPRSYSADMPVVSNAQIETFKQAKQVFKPIVRTAKNKDGHPKKGAEPYYLTDIMRPFVTENIAKGKKWHDGFADLIVRQYDEKQKYIDKVKTAEKERIRKMHEKTATEEEHAIVMAIDNIMGARYRQIRQNNDNKITCQKRQQSELENWQRRFCGSQTFEQFETHLMRFMSVGHHVDVDRQVIMGMLNEEKWWHCRDLVLLSLATYSSLYSLSEKLCDAFKQQFKAMYTEDSVPEITKDERKRLSKVAKLLKEDRMDVGKYVAWIFKHADQTNERPDWNMLAQVAQACAFIEQSTN